MRQSFLLSARLALLIICACFALTGRPAQAQGAPHAAAALQTQAATAMPEIRIGGRSISSYCVARLVGEAMSSGIYDNEPVPDRVALAGCDKPGVWQGLACIRNQCPPMNAEAAQGYFNASPLGSADGLDYELLQWSSGGSGAFTQILGLRIVQAGEGRGGEILARQFETQPGDRANGGISNARLSGGILHYDRALTLFDIVDTATGGKNPFKAYNSLEACASCGAGFGHYHMGPHDRHETLDSIDVDFNYENQFDDDDGVTDCVMDILADEQAANDNAESGHYAGKALARLGHTFLHHCAALIRP